MQGDKVMIVDALYFSNRGMVACSDHGGGYLTAATRQRPKARNHITPLDHWTRVKASDLCAEDLAWAACEGCGARLQEVPSGD